MSHVRFTAFHLSAAPVAYSVTSGTITMGGVRDFLGDTGSISMSDLYRGGALVADISQNASIPASGEISLSDFYGVSKIA